MTKEQHKKIKEAVFKFMDKNDPKNPINDLILDFVNDCGKLIK